MTRINVVPPSELCDQHLLAEHRELTRIPNAVAKGKFNLNGQPTDYKLGEGHVRFFFNKLLFLQKRYLALHQECLSRGFNVQYIWPENLPSDASLWLDYIPTEKALIINRARIAERMPKKARFTKAKKSLDSQGFKSF
ncbi:pyrimidine dimer DNA glycosylase/endonuclease V [Gallibacterium genomosp. 3]|uniref:Deoxyribonuclease n=1 Tax=Gallibacterium genomosp. 3 TaxID=505345 RepID=A0A1A7QA73_9PAST|nr:pyrimidine dimer DNA glycosylase/endonuclease V [Gallibacterium genomosp. 3]OBX10792.1 deoxyribonuclease [Gallibacterium genomosp. 3]